MNIAHDGEPRFLASDFDILHLMKDIVIGASLSGKTTVARYLRSNTNILVSEMDEELTKLNNGRYPTDAEHKHGSLAPKVIKGLLNKKDVLFFTNTDYFSLDNLREARDKGFKIIQLELNLDELNRRNKNRVKNEGYDDLSEWFEGMVVYQEKIRNAGVVDIVIDASQPVKRISEEIQGVFVR